METNQVQSSNMEQHDVKAVSKVKGNTLLLPFLGLLFAWVFSWIARLATGESIFIRDFFGQGQLLSFSVGDLMMVSGLVLGLLLLPLHKAKGAKTAVTVLLLILVAILIALSALTR